MKTLSDKNFDELINLIGEEEATYVKKLLSNGVSPWVSIRREEIEKNSDLKPASCEQKLIKIAHKYGITLTIEISSPDVGFNFWAH